MSCVQKLAGLTTLLHGLEEGHLGYLNCSCIIPVNRTFRAVESALI